MLTLWTLIKPKKRTKTNDHPNLRSVQVRRHKRPATTATQPEPIQPELTKTPHTAADESMREKYERVTQESLATYGVRVRKWRTSMSGCAWEVRYHDGRTSRLIEAPRPKGPMSAAIFLHEIGHHAIGLGRYSPRCLEEHHAWMWSLAEMDRQGLNITDPVRRRVRQSLQYALDKALRRGLKRVPDELQAFLQR